MSRIEPWTIELQVECERELSKNNIRPLVTEETVMDAVTPTVEDLLSQGPVESELTLSAAKENTTSELVVKQDVEETVEVTANSEGDNDEDNAHEKTEAELIADDSSQATDKSKCFTTAEELGIVLPRHEEEGEEEDEANPVPQGKVVVEQLVLDKVPSVLHKKKHLKNLDQATSSTGAESDIGIPCVIYIRTDLPPEVPSDEPLAQCYNLALPVYTRRQRLRQSVIKRLQFFNKRHKDKNSNDRNRLHNEDLEAYKQTLVDL